MKKKQDPKLKSEEVVKNEDVITYDENEENKEVTFDTEEQQEEEKKKVKKEKIIRNVSVKQCFGTILFSLVMCLSVLIPFTFGSSGLTSVLNYLPFIGNGDILVTSPSILSGVSSLFKFDESVMEIIKTILDYDTAVFYGILLFNIVASLFLAITRLTFLRAFFKFISIIAGFAMIGLVASSIVHIAGFAGLFIMGIAPMDQLMPLLEESGILFSLATLIISAFMIKKQFRWYDRLW
jgi:hypothetical protein